MHVIALASYLSTVRGGLERSLFDVCRGLSERGHSISLLYEEEGDQFEQYQKFCTSLTKINSYKVNVNFLTDIWKIAKEKDSVVYSNQYDNFFFGCVLALAKGIPLVCHLRLHPSHEKNKLKVLKQAITLAHVKRYIAVSNQVRSDWSTELGIKDEIIDVVYNGINPEAFRPSDNFLEDRKKWNIAEDTRVISYVGRLENYKGIETLIKAFSLLLGKGLNARLLIAGKPLISGEEYRNSLEQLSTDLGVETHVRFLGHIADTKSLYQLSDVTVLPSLWAEAFGRTLIESMACGTPVVASRVGGMPEILTGEFQCGLFEPGNERDLSNTLSQIIHWRDKDPQLSERCRKHVLDDFSLDKTIDGVESVLLKTVKHETF